MDIHICNNTYTLYVLRHRLLKWSTAAAGAGNFGWVQEFGGFALHTLLHCLLLALLADMKNAHTLELESKNRAAITTGIRGMRIKLKYLLLNY